MSCNTSFWHVLARWWSVGLFPTRWEDQRSTRRGFFVDRPVCESREYFGKKRKPRRSKSTPLSGNFDDSNVAPAEVRGRFGSSGGELWHPTHPIEMHKILYK